MTTEELRRLDNIARAKNCNLYVFAWWGDTLLSTQQLMFYRPMPCTPPGDLVAELTNLEFDEALEIVESFRV